MGSSEADPLSVPIKARWSGDSIYRTYHLPTSSPSLPFLAGRYASLRLSALLTSPGAFAPTFPTQAVLNPSQWQAKISRTGFETFICVRHPAGLAEEGLSIEGGEWVGQVLMLGPQRREVYELKDSEGPDLGADGQAEGEETRWHLTALYADPGHRGQGVAKQLVNAAVAFAKGYDPSKEQADPVAELLANGVPTAAERVVNGEHKNGPERVRVRLFSRPDNEAALGMYKHLGFENAGKCTLAEALTGNGDADQLPKDGGWSDPGRFHNRKGVVMERIEYI